MKFFQYPHLYLEHFLAQTVEPLCSEKYVTADEMAANFASMDIFSRQRITKRIIKSVKELSVYPSVADFMPKSIVNSQKKLFYTKEEALDLLSPFFSMYSKLERDNDLSRNKWRSELRNCCSHMETKTGGFLDNFSQLRPHMVAVEYNNNTLSVTTSEYFWGIANVAFKDAVVNSGIDEGTVLSGMLTCMEAEVQYDQDGVMYYNFTLLIDTQFSPSPMRCFEQEGWLTVNFTCTDILLDTELCNYAKKLKLFGYGHYALMAGCMFTLDGKASILGREMLTAGEKQMLFLSKLFCSMGLCTAQPQFKGKINYDAVFELLDNRIEFELFLKQLEATKTDCAKRISETLQKSYERYEEEDYFLSGLILRSLKRYISSMCRMGYFELTAKYFSDMFLEVTDDLCYDFSYSPAFDFAMELISSTVDEELTKHGFSGQFPHYCKKNKKSEQFISFVCEGNYYSPKLNSVRFDFAVSAAKQRMDYNDDITSDPENDSMGFSDKNAESLKNLISVNYSKFGGEEENNITASFLYPVDGGSRETLIENSGKFLKRIILLKNVALSAVSGKKVPVGYLYMRISSLIKSHIIGKSLLKMLPVLSVILSLAFILIFTVVPVGLKSVVIIFAYCLIIYLIAAVIYCLIRLFGVWGHK